VSVAVGDVMAEHLLQDMGVSGVRLNISPAFLKKMLHFLLFILTSFRIKGDHSDKKYLGENILTCAL